MSTDPAGARGPTPGGAARTLTLPSWRATSAHFRAVLLGVVGAVAAVVLRRPDLAVLATPFLVVATWSWLLRPRQPPTMTTWLSHHAVREGEGVRWSTQVTLPDGAEDVVVGLAPSVFAEHDPPLGIASVGREDGDASASPAPAPGAPACDPGIPGSTPASVRTVTSSVGVRPTRWGRRPVGPPHALVLSAWGAYRSGPADGAEHTLTVLPLPSSFDPTAPLPHPEGLVGVHRSNRAGSGSEFNTLRPFQPGDRLRRIHWPVSLRTGTLHVSSTWADEDAAVVLVVDAFTDLGPREGIDGRPTSLDLTVRAAGAMAEHHLASGDRVSVRVLGTSSVRRLPVGSGRTHLRRVLDSLALIEPATERQDDGEWATAGIASGALVVVLSPLVEPASVAIVARLGARGLTTVVVDTMPEHLWTAASEVHTALVWRLRRLTREAEITRLGDLGIPVVPWQGPGSLDLVLRDISRRARAPRMVRR